MPSLACCPLPPPPPHPACAPPPPTHTHTRSDYNGYREENGRFPDGRSFKHFYLTSEVAGQEKLVVSAQDTARRDKCVACCDLELLEHAAAGT